MLVGTPFMILSIFFRSILTGEGDTLMPMKVHGLGTVIYLILDPPLIFLFDIKGSIITFKKAVLFPPFLLNLIFILDYYK